MSRSYWPLKLEKDIDPNKIKNGERHRKSKHSKFHEEVSDLLQDACLRDSFIVEGKDRISSLMNKKDGSFKTKNALEKIIRQIKIAQKYKGFNEEYKTFHG